MFKTNTYVLHRPILKQILALNEVSSLFLVSKYCSEKSYYKKTFYVHIKIYNAPKKSEKNKKNKDNFFFAFF